ncbi:leukocyte surface antigen CD47-like [Myotis lucifugus]|uniref:leukocyte surface antigen CD47-like n=1 Tax=Myotis lucifugus TaxID=59463 RepID=UPI000CCC2CBF|nr:leukocyte surface antigen CD47-like [Myotis lucifugus]
MFVEWKFRNKHIFFYDGDKNESSPNSNFSSAYIVPDALLTGKASLMMDKSDAVPGNYTCEVTELTGEGKTTVELRYIAALWFSANDHALIIIFSMLAVLLFWGSDITVILKYNSNIMKEKIIIISVAGLVLSILVIVGAVFFIPGEYSKKRTSGLGLIVVSTVILILLQISMFMIAPAIGMSSFSITILILQVLGFVLSVVGLRLCVSECIPVHGSLLISGLGITALVALLGLVYIFVASDGEIIDYLLHSLHVVLQAMVALPQGVVFQVEEAEPGIQLIDEGGDVKGPGVVSSSHTVDRQPRQFTSKN